ncbi:MAG: hypothetical protein NTX82_04255 [Candidatus Parcubacteria bacterium]|nr:hypothetical protein [Candidatus Parcubacteria bacterium]
MSNWWETEEPIALKVELNKQCPHCDQPFKHAALVQIPVTKEPYKVNCTNCGREVEVVWITDPHDGVLYPTFTKLPIIPQSQPSQAQV